MQLIAICTIVTGIAMEDMVIAMVHHKENQLQKKGKSTENVCTNFGTMTRKNKMLGKQHAIEEIAG